MFYVLNDRDSFCWDVSVKVHPALVLVTRQLERLLTTRSDGQSFSCVLAPMEANFVWLFLGRSDGSYSCDVSDHVLPSMVVLCFHVNISRVCKGAGRLLVYGYLSY